MRVQEWLDRTQAITGAATEGPWEKDGSLIGRRPGASFAQVWGARWRNDLAFNAHARTALPQAVAALQAVLAQHQAADYQRNVPRMLRRTPEDNLPYRPCDGCGEAWPCTTVTTITETLGDQ